MNYANLSTFSSAADNTYRSSDVVNLFNETFSQSENTRLVVGDVEPIYLPADETCHYHRVVFAHGYYASALHEIAHWCIAGKARRQLVDYGYWYCPDGRDEQQQAEFEKVEVKPQAIEWAFALAAGSKFSVSSDNLNGVETDRKAFEKAVASQLALYQQRGFPPRAQQFIHCLKNHYSIRPRAKKSTAEPADMRGNL
jgi:elongation factor P hydroxylase